MSTTAGVFRNPIISHGADPWVILKDGYYWYCFSDGNRSIYVARSERLEAIGQAVPVLVWQGALESSFSKETWAPELHEIDGRWYIYFAAGDARLAEKNHRIYVLESLSQHPLGPYRQRGSINAASERWAIDGTVLDLGPRARYFVWSGWDNVDNTQQNLYIAKMKNPWTLDQDPEAVQRFGLSEARFHSAGRKVKKPLEAAYHLKEDSWLSFRVEVEDDASYCLEVHYAHPHPLAASLFIGLEGRHTAADPLLLPPSGATNWQGAQTKIELKKGRHEISLRPGMLDAMVRGITVSPYGADRILISRPAEVWEKRGGPPFINEGPQVLRHASRLHLIYSASGSWTDDYALGRLSLEGSDPLNAQDWRKVGPVFSKTKEVFGPGHASFTRSLDGSEHWILYHSAQAQGSGWRRHINLQQFNWAENGEPEFGQPVEPGRTQNAPSTVFSSQRSWREGA